MIVRKFGGTSVGSPEQMKRVCKIINDNHNQIVVLSAISGITNKLVKIAEYLYKRENENAISEIDSMTSFYHDFANQLLEIEHYRNQAHEIIDLRNDFLKSFTRKMFNILQEKALVADGELISTALFSLYLQEKNISSTLIPALNFMRIDKDLEPDEFYIGENLKREIEKESHIQTFITQGFICRNAYGEVDNLKRGGSDYTATIIGAAIQAEKVEIWSDIDGVHNNDPRFVENTKSLTHLSFDEAAELAYFGAKVLHPSSLQPARKADIPVLLKNTMIPELEGTIINTELGSLGIKAIAAKDGITTIRIKSGRMLMAYGFLRKVFEIFEIYKTSIDMITTSEVAISVTIDDTKFLDAIIEDLQKFAIVEVENNQSIIAIVGNMATNQKGYASLVFSALENIPLKMISYGASNHNISLVVDTSQKVDALNSLQNHLF